MRKTVKIIVSGDGGVGKTSFPNRLIHDRFDANSELTKGVDFFSKNIFIKGSEYNIITWDFAGQDQFRRLLNEFVDGSLAAYVMFDLSRFKTLENVQNWIRILKIYGNIPAFILGNKSDLINPDKSHHFESSIAEIRNKYNNVIGYLEISSKTGDNIKKAFDILVEKL